MNIVNRVTLEHMKQNRRRTLVTIVGVIIAVAMITAVTTITGSFMDLFRRNTIRETGLWHVLFEQVPANRLDALLSDGNVDQISLYHDGLFAQIPDIATEQRPYLYVQRYTAQGLEQLPVTLVEGRMPQKEGEIVVSDKLALIGKVRYELGDTLKLNLGKRIGQAEDQSEFELPWQAGYEEDERFMPLREETYTVVGVIDPGGMERNWYGGYQALALLDPAALEGETVNAKVALKQVDNGLYAWAEDMADRLGLEGYGTNSRLLTFSGVMNDPQLMRTMITCVGIVGGIIMIGAVSLIYNAFSISLSERSRQLGMLASIGATRQQKRRSVLFEGTVVGVISIPIGLLAGTVGMGITFACISPLVQQSMGVEEPLKLVVSFPQMAAAVAASVLTIALSAYAPAKRASQITPIDAIRQSADVTLKAKSVHTWSVTRKIFGFEAELGLKNMKRNRHRYRTTLFSLVVSVVLFLTASGFTYYLNHSYSLAQGEIPYDIMVSIQGSEREEYEALLKQVMDTPNVEDIRATDTLYAYLLAQADQLTPESRSRLTMDNGAYPLAVNLIALDETHFKQYVQGCGLDPELVLASGEEGAVLVNALTLKEGHVFTQMDQLACSVGERLNLTYHYGDTLEKEVQIPVTVAAIADKTVYGDQWRQEDFPDQVMLITTWENLNRIYDGLPGTEENKRRNIEVNITCQDDLAVEEALTQIANQNPYQDTHLDVYNMAESRRSSESAATIFSVFVYGFVILICAIAVANIFNTISTSIALRRREFAMLQSVGMTPRGFRKMIRFETLFYGIKALAYGLPISLAVLVLIYQALRENFSFAFSVPWVSVLGCIAGVFAIVGVTMVYAAAKTRKGNLIDALKQENL